MRKINISIVTVVVVVAVGVALKFILWADDWFSNLLSLNFLAR
jgi:hypothetical protein